MQKGSVQLFVIVAVLIVTTVGGLYFYNSQNVKKQADLTQVQTSNKPVLSNITAPLTHLIKPQPKDYSNLKLGFKFSYDNSLEAKEDSEEAFNKRGGGDFRKNFAGYVQYEPGKALGVAVVLDKSQSYDQNPFTVWVFENPNNLSIDAWYKNYWYFPFVWGDFTYTGKITLAPKMEATISGQMAKSGVIDYQPGKPKFVYVSKDGKMYLFRIIGSDGDKILTSFKFL